MRRAALRSISLAILCSLALAAGGCSQAGRTEKEAEEATAESPERQSPVSDEEWLKRRRVLSIDSVIPGLGKDKPAVLFLFNYYDCGTCMEHGFQAVRRIDQATHDGFVKVVASMFTEISSTQRLFGYREYVYNDARDLIRKELKYLPTPVLLIVDGDHRIRDVYMFTPEKGGSDWKVILEKCIETGNE